MDLCIIETFLEEMVERKHILTHPVVCPSSISSHQQRIDVVLCRLVAQRSNPFQILYIRQRGLEILDSLNDSLFVAIVVEEGLRRDRHAEA